jgi:hypothetical protein
MKEEKSKTGGEERKDNKSGNKRNGRRSIRLN